jgi:hypothetical protein
MSARKDDDDEATSLKRRKFDKTNDNKSRIEDRKKIIMVVDLGDDETVL